MNVAFLFDADDETLGGWYGLSVLNIILGTKVLQEATRHMRIAIGDILTYSHVAQHGTYRTIDEVVSLNRLVYQSDIWCRIRRDRLERTYGRRTVYSWFFQNMDLELAEQLDNSLDSEKAYLGALAINFGSPFHLQFFRFLLIERYRFWGRSCSIFYSMSENEDPDVAIREAFEQHGFVVSYEDTGARHTIFDNYDKLEHFRRIKDFEDVFTSKLGWSEDQTSELVLILEEIHPRLFDILAAATRTLYRSETTEDLAQVMLSGRRFLEALADMLFPPRSKAHEGRDVGPTKYKNRLWAYIRSAMIESGKFNEESLIALGREADRLLSIFNSGLHHELAEDRVCGALSDLGHWLHKVIHVNIQMARKPYLAYDVEIQEFLARELGMSNEGRQRREG